MKKNRKKNTKKRKKFFIILSCYIAVFVITCLATTSTLAWFSGSTFSKGTVYLGGPVYLYFGDSEGNKTSQEDQLTLIAPPGWQKLYPGMNIQFKARAILQGTSKVDVVDETGVETTIYATGAILRARIMIEVLPPENANYDEETIARITQGLYDNVWVQMKAKAVSNTDSGNKGVWIFDKDYNYTETGLEEDHFFYYVMPNQTGITNSGKYTLIEVGGSNLDDSVGFLDNAVITLSGIRFENEHAECKIKFTIIFHALQAYLPILPSEVNQAYPGDTSGRIIQNYEVGDPKPLTVENSRLYFSQAFDDIYGDTESGIY